MKPNEVMPAPCAAWAEQLAAQPVDLTTEECTALADHMLTCPSCTAVQTAYRVMDASILTLPPVAPLAALPPIDGIAGGSHSDKKDRHKTHSSALHPAPVSTERESAELRVSDKKRPRRWVRVVSGLAAVLVVGVLVAGFLTVIGARGTLLNGQGSGSTLYVASVGNDGTVYAVHPDSGEVIWQNRLDDKLIGDLLVVKNTLFAISLHGHVYALSKSDGKALWSSQITQGSTPLSVDIHGTVAADGQNLYLSSRQTLYAVDSLNGKVLWRHTALGCACTTSLVAAGGGVVYVFMDGFYALRASDGTVLWHHPEILAAPIILNGLIVAGGKVYVSLGQGGLVDVLRVSDGQLLRTLSFHSSSPVGYSIVEMAFADGILYVNSDGHDLYAIRATDDNTLWHRGGSESGLYGLSTANDGTLYFAITVVASSSISVTSSSISGTDIGQHVTPTPTVSMGTPAAEIYALNASDGSQRWHLQPANSNGYTSAVLAMGGSVYLSIGGRLYALSGKDGKQLWVALNAPALGTPIVG